MASVDRLAPAITAVRLASDRLATTPPTDTAAVGSAMAQLGVSLGQFQRLVAAAGRLATTNGFEPCGQALRVPPIPNATTPTGSQAHVPPPRADSPARRFAFRKGRTVAAVSGCLACHRIAGGGSPGPGPDLTAIGTRLPSSAIARALRSPLAPMPSYRALAMDKFDALVAFLSGLRGQPPGGVAPP